MSSSYTGTPGTPGTTGTQGTTRTPGSSELRDDVTQKAKAATAGVTDDLKSKAHDVADSVTSQAAGYADQAKDTVAEEVKSVASALRTAADEMRSGSASERTFSQIADGLAEASESMRDKDLGQIVGTLNDFARRKPMVFLGAAALVGFAATRFAKASGEGSQAISSASAKGGGSDQWRATGVGRRSGSSEGSAMASPGVHTSVGTRNSQGDRG